MIKYRPHRGSLADAMAEAKEFSSEAELIDHVWKEWNDLRDVFRTGKQLFTREDIVIGEVIGNDDRIGWKNVRHVCVKRMGSDVYDHPQCIGWCGE